MAKKITGFIKLQVPAGKANPSPDRSGARSARPEHHGILQGVQRQTQGMEPGLPIPVVITAFADKSFTFIMKTPPATILIKKAAGIQKAAKPHTDKVGRSPRPGRGHRQGQDAGPHRCRPRSRQRTIAGSARSMGITVEGL